MLAKTSDCSSAIIIKDLLKKCNHSDLIQMGSPPKESHITKKLNKKNWPPCATLERLNKMKFKTRNSCIVARWQPKKYLFLCSIHQHRLVHPGPPPSRPYTRSGRIPPCWRSVHSCTCLESRTHRCLQHKHIKDSEHLKKEAGARQTAAHIHLCDLNKINIFLSKLHRLTVLQESW